MGQTIRHNWRGDLTELKDFQNKSTAPRCRDLTCSGIIDVVSGCCTICNEPRFSDKLQECVYGSTKKA